ncbi:MAG: isoprenyl transferase [Candidatus Omnitrophica bacterium]|nr:isoprenyl transferase [Candidatus Omnitrophota bacterium]
MHAKEKIPEHIAIIMDGNGRWANKKGLPRIAGHRQGAKVIKSIVKQADAVGVKFLTLYTFSTENWKRPQAEVNFLMQLLSVYLKKELNHLKGKNVRFLTIGMIEALPKLARDILNKAKLETRENTGLTLILALNYGARSEILQAALSLHEDIEKGKIDKKSVSEMDFSKYLYTSGIPDPELLIRTSGEKRLSNFLLWQLSYSEIYITDRFWPDFDKDEFNRAIEDFQNRKRRFGDVRETKS